jgi:anti-anti-sigma factor
MALEVTHRSLEGIEILYLSGHLTFGEGDLALRQEIAAAIDSGSIRLVINLDHVTDLDSTGLGTLLFAQAELKNTGGGLALSNLRPAHLALLVVAKLETFFEIFDRDREAINSFFPDRKTHRFNLEEFLAGMRAAR